MDRRNGTSAPKMKSKCVSVFFVLFFLATLLHLLLPPSAPLPLPPPEKRLDFHFSFSRALSLSLPLHLRRVESANEVPAAGATAAEERRSQERITCKNE